MELYTALASFGTDWWYVAVPVALALLVAGALVRRSAGTDDGVVLRFADGAAQVTGLPRWAAATHVLLLGALLIAFAGFFWDVAWHISIGRDEFLFSPPHLHLLLGTTGVGVAGVVGVHVATRTGVTTGWRVRRWQVPFGNLALLVMGAMAITGYWVDEFWHGIYGLDVTMWSPPHMLMIGSVMFAPLAFWLIHAEAHAEARAGSGHGGHRAHRPGPHRHRLVARAMVALSAGAVLVGVSAAQFEYDLGVSQWPQAAQLVLIAAAAGFALPLARAAIGRGGALLAVAVFVLLRGAAAAVTAGVWSLEVPRFPLYLGAAVAVELAYRATAGRTPRTRALVAGAAVGTIGLAGEWLWMQVWGYHPWGAGMWPVALLGTVAALALAPLGVAFGRIVAHRDPGIGGRLAAVGALVAVAGVAPTMQRAVADDVSATVVTTPAEVRADGVQLVDVVVELDPVDAAVDADRFEVFQWQGGERTITPLVPTATPGRYVSERPAPVGGMRKTMVTFVSGNRLGAVPIALPADPEIGASAIPLQEVRQQAMQRQQDLFLREAIANAPAWPGRIASVVIAACILATLGAIAAGAVGLDRRRRDRLHLAVPPTRVDDATVPTVPTAGSTR